MNIQGQWTGTIIYGKGYTDHKNKELYFDLEVLQDNNHITGISIDTGGVGASPDSAKIVGTFANNKIAFIKQYSSWHYYSEGQIKIDKSISGPKIRYAGSYYERQEIFQGKWIIKGCIKKMFGLIPIRYRLKGIWTMRRK